MEENGVGRWLTSLAWYHVIWWRKRSWDFAVSQVMQSFPWRPLAFYPLISPCTFISRVEGSTPGLVRMKQSARWSVITPAWHVTATQRQFMKLKMDEDSAWCIMLLNWHMWVFFCRQERQGCGGRLFACVNSGHVWTFQLLPLNWLRQTKISCKPQHKYRFRSYVS